MILITLINITYLSCLGKKFPSHWLAWGEENFPYDTDRFVPLLDGSQGVEEHRMWRYDVDSSLEMPPESLLQLVRGAQRSCHRVCHIPSLLAWC